MERLKLSKHKQFSSSSEQTDGKFYLFNEAEQFSDKNALEPKITEVKAH